MTTIGQRRRQPASIRTNNPGAQWPGPSARRFGSTSYENVAGGNRAAIFSSPVLGAAAQFDLLNRRYVGKPLAQAIATWSGGNASRVYAQHVARALGIRLDAPLTREMIAGPQGLKLARAMAAWETGKPFPLTDEQWAQAQALAFGARQQLDQATAVSAAPADAELANMEAPADSAAHAAPDVPLPVRRPATAAADPWATQALYRDTADPHTPLEPAQGFAMPAPPPLAGVRTFNGEALRRQLHNLFGA